MKKEILTGLIVIVAIAAIAAIAIFTVTPSMSTSFEIDGKRTSDEMELLFPGSGDDNYQEDNYVSEKFKKIKISASSEGTEVYEAGFGSGFFDCLKEWLSGWLNEKIVDINEAFPIGDGNLEDTNPDAVIEGIDKIVEDEKAGEPGSTPVVGAATGKYAGPMELIIDGDLSEDEQSMLKAMGVGEMEFGDGSYRYYAEDGSVVPGVKHSVIAFRGNDLYFYEEAHPEVVAELRPGVLGYLRFKSSSKKDFPMIECNFGTKTGFLITKEEDAHTGNYPQKFKISGAQLGPKTEYVVKDLSRKFIEKNIGENFIIQTLGGELRSESYEIKEIDVKLT
jgi:hypothetical protein